MGLRPRIRRQVALVMLAVLGFAQASVALAACAMDRGELAQAAGAPSHGMPAGHECCDEEDAQAGASNLCFAHCTSDLQAFGWAGFAVAAAPRAVIVVQLQAVASAPPAAVAEAPPPRVPPRILLHSFLI
jgi:hypothetical protein